MLIKLIDYGAVNDMTLPMRMHYNDSGAEIYTPNTLFLQPGETRAVTLGFGIDIPAGHMGLILPVPALAQKGVTCLPVPIDAENTREVFVILSNIGKQKRIITRKEPIGQLVILPIVMPEFIPEDQLSMLTHR